MTTWDNIKTKYNIDFLLDLVKREEAVPPVEKLFRAFDLCPFNKTKIVILGESPYSNGQATGLAFSGLNKISPSLNTVYRELYRTHGILNTASDLEAWAKQGILLVNSVLSTRPGQPQSHKHVGWERFIGVCLIQLCEEINPIFVAWGHYAKTFYKACGITPKTARVLSSAHPSPLARGQFIGNNHFVLIDKELKKRAEKKIQWKIPSK